MGRKLLNTISSFCASLEYELEVINIKEPDHCSFPINTAQGVAAPTNQPLVVHTCHVQTFEAAIENAALKGKALH